MISKYFATLALFLSCLNCSFSFHTQLRVGPPLTTFSGLLSHRRDVLTAAGIVGTMCLFPSTSSAATKPSKVLVLGSTGLLGSEVSKKLSRLDISFIGTSTDGRGGTEVLRITDDSSSLARFREIADVVKPDAIISCIGSFNDDLDYEINSFTGLIAEAFPSIPITYISVAPEVMAAVDGSPILNKYMRGKNFSNDRVGEDGLIRPTFVYGGESFGVNPPRVTSSYGRLIEKILSSGLVRGTAAISPGLIKVALEPPISAENVAGAAVAKCLGATGNASTHDEINELAKKLN